MLSVMSGKGHPRTDMYSEIREGLDRLSIVLELLNCSFRARFSKPGRIANPGYGRV